MDFDPPEELRDLVGVVRRFRERELDPHEEDFLRTGHLDRSVRDQLDATARRSDLWALEVPEEYGGQGIGVLGTAMVAEEMFKSPTMYLFGGNPEGALYEGDEEQRERYLFPVVRGERRGCYAFTEPDSGSDVAGMQTRAVRTENGWSITGSKTFISRANEADFVILYATTEETGKRGTTCFLVDKGTPGFEISRTIATMGDDWDPCELSFDRCEVPDSARLGEVGAGWTLGAEQLTHGRIKIAAYQLGIARRCLDIAIDWARVRTTWGKPLAARQAVQWMVADSEVELDAARMMVYKAAWLADRHDPDTRRAAFAAKLYATEMSGRVTDRAVQVLGGLGYTRELPVQSFYRQARLWRIGHGTSEILRWMIAREALGPAAKD